jgi:hypothetical protein
LQRIFTTRLHGVEFRVAVGCLVASAVIYTAVLAVCVPTCWRKKRVETVVKEVISDILDMVMRALSVVSDVEEVGVPHLRYGRYGSQAWSWDKTWRF